MSNNSTSSPPSSFHPHQQQQPDQQQLPQQDSTSYTASSTATTNNNQNFSTTAMSTKSEAMCKKFGVQVHIISCQEDISSSNEVFQNLFKVFNQDVYNNNNYSSSTPTSPTANECLPLVIGIDVEWGVTETPAVIQLASRHACFVVIVARDHTLLEPFRAVLADKDVVKAGVGVRADKQKIEMINKYQVHGEVDLAAIVCRTPEANQVQNLSLARITSFYCNHTLNKDMAIVCSNWESEVLSQEQLEYAADDSLAGLMAFDAIMKKHINAGTSKVVSSGSDNNTNNNNTTTNVFSSSSSSPSTTKPAEEEVSSTLLAPASPSAFYSSTTNNNSVAASPSAPSNSTLQKPSFDDDNAGDSQQQQQQQQQQNTSTSAGSTTPLAIARVNRTPMEWAKKYIKRKVLLKQPKNNSNNNKQRTSAAAAASSLSSDPQQQHQQDQSNGIIARFETKMEKRYQTVSETQDSLHRIATSGVQAVGPDNTNLFCLDVFKAAWYVKKGIATALEYVDDDETKPLKRIRLNFTPNKKTKVCRTWHINNGYCPNETCPFAHGSSDLKENIRDETREVNESITAKALSKRSLRTRCDMCRAQNAGINALSVVPGPWLRLMGEEVADETGSSIGLHLCCKCQALMRAVFVSERRLLRNNAANFFLENDLYFGKKNPGDDDDEAEEASSDSSASDDDEDEDEQDDGNEKNKNNKSKKKKNGPEPESTLLAKINEASMTRMCSLCQLIVCKKRSSGVPDERIKQIVERINVFYDMLVKDGILLGRVAPLAMGDDDHTNDTSSSSIHERALKIAAQINQFSKGDWLASAEARDIARYFCLRPVDEDRERPAGIVTNDEEEKFIKNLANQLREEKSLDSLRVAEPQYSAFWAKRMFEYYRSIFEQQLRPVIVPWTAFCREARAQMKHQNLNNQKDNSAGGASARNGDDDEDDEKV